MTGPDRSLMHACTAAGRYADECYRLAGRRIVPDPWRDVAPGQRWAAAAEYARGLAAEGQAADYEARSLFREYLRSLPNGA